MSYKSDLVDVSGYVVRETGGAVLFYAECQESDEAVWLPKSRIEVVAEGGRANVLGHFPHTVTLPKWLAIAKELA